MAAIAAPTAAADPVLGEIVLLLRRIVYAPAGSITPETELHDLGLDSLDLVEVGLELEGLLGREIAVEALRDVRTVADLARHVAPPPPAGLSRAA